MSRRLRIESLGYHHIYNRGVAKGNIFEDEKDKAKFIELMATVAKEFKFNIHSFCLMDNHYHILLENKRENLSSGMRQLNAQYASYFNKRHNRVGHLWQDRFKSWFVLDEQYLFTLFKYIENNPVKAKMSERIGAYPYCATYSIFKDAIPLFLENSFVLREYHTQELFEVLNIPLNETEVERIEAFHRTRYKQVEGQITPLHVKELTEYFLHVKEKAERNIAINNAYADRYTKSEISRFLHLSVAGVSKILKS
ncbi:MAG: transposase [Campylobacterales bacterium]|nr:transposase [Campylobacterales bacterium]